MSQDSSSGQDSSGLVDKTVVDQDSSGHHKIEEPIFSWPCSTAGNRPLSCPHPCSTSHQVICARLNGRASLPPATCACSHALSQTENGRLLRLSSRAGEHIPPCFFRDRALLSTTFGLLFPGDILRRLQHDPVLDDRVAHAHEGVLWARERGQQQQGAVTRGI